MKLYSYNRSSAAYRVRIALNLKAIPHDIVAVNLLEAEEQGKEYLKVNPQGLVPALEDNGNIITQSTSIIEYIEEKFPQVPLLPTDLTERAIVRAMCNVVACDIHPVDNLRVLKYLVGKLGASEEQKMEWYHHWILEGFKALELQLADHSNGKFCFGDSVSMADLYLIPQVYNANRFNVDMQDFPLISQINDHCTSIDAFVQAAPEKQADFK